MTDKEITKLIQENRELKRLLALSGASQDYKSKNALLPDIVGINAAITNLVNKGAILGIDLHSLGVLTEPSPNITIETLNYPIQPIFSVNPKVLKEMLNVCSIEELYPAVLLEHLKLL